MINKKPQNTSMVGTKNLNPDSDCLNLITLGSHLRGHNENKHYQKYCVHTVASDGNDDA